MVGVPQSEGVGRNKPLDPQMLPIVIAVLVLQFPFLKKNCIGSHLNCLKCLSIVLSGVGKMDFIVQEFLFCQSQVLNHLIFVLCKTISKSTWKNLHTRQMKISTSHSRFFLFVC